MPWARNAAATFCACSTVEQNTTVWRPPAFSFQWLMTWSVTGDLSMISATAFMSKSEATRRTFFSASWTPTLTTKVRGFTR